MLSGYSPKPSLFLQKRKTSELLVRDFDGSLYHQSISDRHQKMVLSIVDVTEFKNPLPASAELNFNTWAFFQSVLFVFIFAGSKNRFPKMNMICKKNQIKRKGSFHQKTSFDKNMHCSLQKMTLIWTKQSFPFPK